MMDTVKIYELLAKTFDLDELNELSWRLDVDFENIKGSTKSAKVREFIQYLDRRSRLDELRTLVLELRPEVDWAGEDVPEPIKGDPPLVDSRWQLGADDFNRLVDILASLPEFRTAQGRVAFIDELFMGSPKKSDIVSRINVDGTPRSVSVSLITLLVQYGQDVDGQETLGLLINKLLSYKGGGSDADFLRSLFDTYPLHEKPAATKRVSDWHGGEQQDDVQEKIIGENTLRDVRILELALEASKAVVRIVAPSTMGSGFLVAPNLIMTNNHVIGREKDARSCDYQFHYQLDKRWFPLPVRAARKKEGGLFYTDVDLDVTVVEVEGVPENVTPLTLTRKLMRRDERVNIIQHPGGSYKKISLQNNFVAYSDSSVLQYLTSTEPGSSGSPVMDNDFLVVGIHHSGGLILEPSSGRKYLRNAGSTMNAVLDDLQVNAPQIFEQLKIYSNS